MFGDLFRDVFLNLFRKKLRALLTMTGVIIGSFLVVLILSLSHGLSEFLDQQVRAVWDERMIKVRLKKGGAPEKMAKGLFGGLGEPPQEVKKENRQNPKHVIIKSANELSLLVDKINNQKFLE